MTKRPRPADYARLTVPAPLTCAQKGWKPGVMLTSSKWKEPRQIAAVDAFEVVVLVRDHGSLTKRHAVKLFPVDVKVCGEAEVAA